MRACPQRKGSPDRDSDVSVACAAAPARVPATLRSIVEAAPLGIVLLDNELRCLHCNEAATRVAGLPVELMLGRAASQALGALWPALRGACERVLAGRTAVVHVDLDEPLAGTRAPAGRAWTVSVRPLPSRPVDLPRGVSLFFDEVSAFRRRELELRRACQAAEEASAAKDRFLAMLSHELRTPLTPVLLAVQALQADPGIPASARNLLEVVHRNLRLEVALVDDLLDLNRITHGKLELRTGPLDMHAAVREALQICAGDARAKQVTLRLRADASRACVLADGVRMQQVLWNLLKNGIKFSLPAGEVEVRTRNECECLVVEIIDGGIGIEPRRLPQLFEAFEQGSLPDGHRNTGLGLGLALARSLTELHGGSLTAESAGTGRGAMFRLALPLAPPAPHEPASDAQLQRETPRGPDD